MYSFCPSGESATSFVFRTKTLVSSSFSREAMWALMVGCVRNSFFAAFEKLPD